MRLSLGEHLLGAGEVAAAEADRAQLHEGPAVLAAHPGAKLRAGCQRLLLGFGTGARDTQQLGSVHAAAAVQRSDARAVPPTSITSVHSCATSCRARFCAAQITSHSIMPVKRASASPAISRAPTSSNWATPSSNRPFRSVTRARQVSPMIAASGLFSLSPRTTALSACLNAASMSPHRKRSYAWTAARLACSGTSSPFSSRRSARRTHPRTGAISAVSMSRWIATLDAARAAPSVSPLPSRRVCSCSHAAIEPSRSPCAYRSAAKASSSTAPPVPDRPCDATSPPIRELRSQTAPSSHCDTGCHAFTTVSTTT